MARKEKNIHYLYKTTCNVTGRYYIGMHSTNNENDGYMGSGKRLRRSIRKYGAENHTKEILEYFDSRELLIEAEKKAITEDMINDDNCMNLRAGGEGGFSSEEHRVKFIEVGIENFKFTKEKMLNSVKEKRKDEIWVKKQGEKIKQGQILSSFNYNTFEGRIHSEESKQLMSEKAKGRTSEQNSQYGTCWITKEGENKKIKKEDFEIWLNKGWVKGRK